MISIMDFFNAYSAFICALALFWYYCTSKYSYWKKLNVKYLKPVPLFGNISRIILRKDSLQEFYHRIYESLGDEPYGGFYQFFDPILMVKDPQLISDVLVKDFKSFCDRDVTLISNEDANRDLNTLSSHLFTTKGERWRILRQKMNAVFTSGKLKLMQDQVFDCVALLIESIEKQMSGSHSLDLRLKEQFERYTIDVILSCAFGLDCNSMKSNDEFSEMGRAFFRPRIATALRLMVAAFSKRLVTMLRIRDQPKKVTDFFLKLTLDTIEYRRKNGVTRPDVLQLLMELQNSHVNPKFAVRERNNVLVNERFDEIDIAANTSLFFLAGFETAATTLSFCLYELALNENVQQRLRTEVQQIKDKHNGLNYNCFKEMTYMDSVFAETLRMYPPVVLLNRECTEDYNIPNTKTHLPAGTKIVIPVWSIHHDWKYYPNPEVFDPERFAGDFKDKLHKGIYQPFGDGPRYCIGKRFADMEMKAVLSVMLLKYNIKPCEKTEIPLKFIPSCLIPQTICGTWVNISKR